MEVYNEMIMANVLKLSSRNGLWLLIECCLSNDKIIRIGHLPYARHCTKQFAYAYLIPHSNYRVGTMITPLLQMIVLKD